jgi:hypothetical protein
LETDALPVISQVRKYGHGLLIEKAPRVRRLCLEQAGELFMLSGDLADGLFWHHKSSLPGKSIRNRYKTVTKKNGNPIKKE